MGKRVLVIEDEAHIQKLVKLVLEKNGFEIIQALSGEDGLKELDKDPHPDLVLLDIMMPGIDGMQVLRTMKGTAETKEIPVIMLTALAQENVVLEGVKLGAKGYIRKPFNPKDLVSRVTEVIAAASAAA